MQQTHKLKRPLEYESGTVTLHTYCLVDIFYGLKSLL